MRLGDCFWGPVFDQDIYLVCNFYIVKLLSLMNSILLLLFVIRVDDYLVIVRDAYFRCLTLC
jgi:hypothetical protein